jgi:hypothetical protein
VVRPISVRLKDRHSEALAELLPMLLCGEESAVLAFGSYTQSALLGPTACREFHGVQTDEARHAVWLQRLRMTLPPPRPDSRLRMQLRGFYARMIEPDFGAHLAHIAALDSAVCSILGALRQRRGPISSDRVVSRLLGCIHRDEARHVTIVRRYARLLRNADDLHDLAGATRRQLTQILAERAGAFELLGVCPDSLFDRLHEVPRSLFT